MNSVFKKTLTLFGLRTSCLLAAMPVLLGQWALQNSGSTADFRGVHSLGKGVAWVSGTRSTVLRTTDGGKSWTACAIPPNADGLDFRGVQVFDERSAVVMAAGKGAASRVYRTTDGCKSWSLVFMNPDAEGFWDEVRFAGSYGVLIGDPVGGKFAIFTSSDAGASWRRFDRVAVPASGGQSLFAASNTSLIVRGRDSFSFITGGGRTAVVDVEGSRVKAVDVPLRVGETAGGFSIVSRGKIFVAVGGDYKMPDEGEGTAARMAEGKWTKSEAGPHGYRSAVDYAGSQGWIAVGPNGTDVSSDDGKTWRALKGDGSGRDWNALSFPFAVGPKGRIGKFISKSGSSSSLP